MCVCVGVCVCVCVCWCVGVWGVGVCVCWVEREGGEGGRECKVLSVSKSYSMSVLTLHYECHYGMNGIT